LYFLIGFALFVCSDVASRMAVPHTLFALDNIRPDLLIFRAMSTCLIMWDDGVQPTTGWVRSKLPALLLQGLFMMPLRAAEAKAEAARQLEAQLDREEREQEEKGAAVKSAAASSTAAAAATVFLDDVDIDIDDDDYDFVPAAQNMSHQQASNIANTNTNTNANIQNGISNRNSNINNQICMSARASFQALVCILAGNAWGLALRYAGTSDR
jgi:hypothetical protein